MKIMTNKVKEKKQKAEMIDSKSSSNENYMVMRLQAIWTKSLLFLFKSTNPFVQFCR